MKEERISGLLGGDDDDNNDDDADDIYIMMQCLSVTKNDHFLLGVFCNLLLPSITTLYNSRLVFMVLHSSRWFFMVPGWFLTVPDAYVWLFMV